MARGEGGEEGRRGWRGGVAVPCARHAFRRMAVTCNYSTTQSGYCHQFPQLCPSTMHPAVNMWAKDVFV